METHPEMEDHQREDAADEQHDGEGGSKEEKEESQTPQSLSLEEDVKVNEFSVEKKHDMKSQGVTDEMYTTKNDDFAGDCESAPSPTEKLEAATTSVKASAPPSLERSEAVRDANGIVSRRPGAVAIPGADGETGGGRFDDPTSSAFQEQYHRQQRGHSDENLPSAHQVSALSAELVVTSPASVMEADVESSPAYSPPAVLVEAHPVDDDKRSGDDDAEITLRDVCRNRTFRWILLIISLVVAALVIGLAVGLERDDNGNDDDDDGGD